MSANEIIDQGVRRSRSRLRYVVPVLLAVPIIGVIAFAAVTATSKASLKLTSGGLASVSTPFGTGTVVRVSAVGGREQKDVPVALHGHEIWPTEKVAPGERVTVVATVKRPGWIGWLAGSSERLTLTMVAPVAHVSSNFITRGTGQPLMVKFQEPVRVVGSGSPGSQFDPHALTSPENSLTLNTTASAGTIAVAAAVRSWETPSTTTVSWFPRGRRASVVALPAPGSRITPNTDITLTFSKTVAQVLGRRRPPVNPSTPGVWHNINAHTIVFEPTGYGYGLGASVNVLLPASVDLIGSKQTTRGSGAYPVVGTWTVPQPSTLALQELLAQLGYLPVNFTPRIVVSTKPTKKPTKPTKKPTKTTTTGSTTTTASTTTTTASTTTTSTTPTSTSTTTTGTTTNTGTVTGDSVTNAGATSTGTSTATTPTTSDTGGVPPTAGTARAVGGVAHTVAAEEAAITNPPKGVFSWRYANTPGALKALWSATRFTELTKGAIMAFENTMGLTVDGISGQAVWKALIAAAVKGERSTFGYTFVMVSEHEPENIRVWHDGKIVVHGLVNTGIPAAPTATGTYAVYEHLTVTTMSGINPDGTPYHDPGIPWVSYFNGGDALHGFIRASYGFPQSLGCVEMPYTQAGRVWPYTPIGTIVNLTAA